MGLVSHAEVYFAVQGIPLKMEVQNAQICMEGATWHWFKVLKESNPQLMWEKLELALFDRFYSIEFTDRKNG